MVTLQVGPPQPAVRHAPQPAAAPELAPAPPRITPRQRKVLLLINELGSAGPSSIAKELGMSPSTAYRELYALETLQLVATRGPGKRTLTEEGIVYLDTVFEP